MNVWFGTDWGAPVCAATPQVPVPIGGRCLWCDERITADDSGVGTPFMESGGNVSQAFYHVECWARQVLGSVGHQLKLCPCYGGDYEGEPEGLSKRDGARAAWDLARRPVNDP